MKYYNILKIQMSILFILSSVSPVFCATSLTQYGITWSFGNDYTVGQFITGDYYVVDPGDGVRITNITNSYHNYPGSGYDGSMINPDPSIGNQGFDSRAASYDPSINVRLNGFPITLNGGQSLVSSVSIIPNETGYQNIPRPTNHVVAILTCLFSAPEAGSFRPPYAGTNKTIRNTSEVRYSNLPLLDPVPNTISISSADRFLSYPQVNFVTDYFNRETHPRLNTPEGPYGANFTHSWGASILRIFVNSGDRTDLINYTVQLGIDLYGILVTGGRWPANGGHNMGRLTPILVAGWLLNDSNMLGIATTFGHNKSTFQEWGNILYVTQPHIDSGPHTQSCLGLPDYDAKAYRDGFDSVCNSDCGGAINTSRYWDENGSQFAWNVLICELLDLEDEFGNQAYFDFTRNNWMEDVSGDLRFGYSRGTAENISFIGNMWDAYHNSNYPNVPEPVQNLRVIVE